MIKHHNWSHWHSMSCWEGFSIKIVDKNWTKIYISLSVYIGLTEKTFKTRYYGHTQSFRNQKNKHKTTLSTYVWDLKDKNIEPSFKWSIIRHARPYSNKSKKCPLCLEEKFQILFYENKRELLNKRSEIIAKCRHMNKFLLANYKSKDWAWNQLSH